MTRAALAIVIAIVGAGCKDKDARKEDTPPAAGGSPAAAAAAAAPAAGSKTIEALKLAFDGPADAQLNDMSMGGTKSVLINAPGLVFSVSEVGAAEPATFEEALESTKMYDGTQVTKQEKTADGWHLEFRNKGSLGDNFFVDIRRVLGGRPITCRTTVSLAEQAAAAVKACQSLRAM